MTKFLVIKVVAKNGSKLLFERDLTITDGQQLRDFPFATVIDALDALFSPIPHDVSFELQFVS